MKQDFIFVFILLAILSIVNAIPHQLHKRVTTFMPCPKELSSSPLTVSISPDPLVPGQTATFTISGKLAMPAPQGSMLFITFVGKAGAIGKPFAADICAKTACPADSINIIEQVPVPAELPESFGSNVLVSDSSAKTIYGCAVAIVGDPKAI